MWLYPTKPPVPAFTKPVRLPVAKLLVILADPPTPVVLFSAINPPPYVPEDAPEVIDAVEKLFTMSLGKRLLLEELMPMRPPNKLPPVIEPVEKLLLMGPELLPTNPPKVPVVLLATLVMETLAKLFKMAPELVLTKPPVPLAALEVLMLTPTSRINPDEVLNNPMAPVPVRLLTV